MYVCALVGVLIKWFYEISCYWKT